MKVALLIITYNRLNYLKECFWSIEHADLSQVDTIMVIDNNSDVEVKNFIQASNIVRFKESYPNMALNNEKHGISANLLQGYEYLFNNGYDIVINFDSDAVVRPDCITKLLELYKPGTLLTGFHSTTENRHKIISEHAGYCIKESVGGINFCIDSQAYRSYVKPALERTIPHGNFDHQSCLGAGSVMCAVPSLVQHIGFESSLGHGDNPDIADDFYYYHLPDVTLLGIDSNKERLDKAEAICTKWIKYGDIASLSPDIKSKEEYSHFIIKEAYKHVKTSHMLIFQHDGYVHNWKAWNNDWLQYDYIGAPWWYNDGMNVGNGGFSLRSRRLMEIVANDKYIESNKLFHPEDDVICRKYRTYLESTYDIKFAPIEVAEKFSFEGYMQPTKILSDQFGVHGSNPRTQIHKVNNPVKNKYVINQFQGLGDLLFIVPLIRALQDEGNELIWPIADHYYNISKHFLDLDMRPKSSVNINYNCKLRVNTPYGQLLPYRFANELLGVPLTQCMQSKYRIYGHNWKQWRNLTYTRYPEKEKALIAYLNLNEQSVFQLVNIYFGEAERGATITPKPNPLLPIVEMKVIAGFSLIDWLGIIELAKELHIANSSLMYLLELMELNKPVYVYKRHTWGEVNYEHTAELWTNKNFIFE